MLTSRYQFGSLLSSLGLTGEAVEVGVAEGGFSFTLLDNWPGILHMVDCWQHIGNGYQDGCNIPDADQEARYQLVVKGSVRYGSRAVIHRAFSREAASLFVPGELDFVYLDANHAYPFICEDWDLWYPLVKSGGIFAGHDYLDGTIGGSLYGVKPAVTERAAMLGLEINVVDEEWPSWWVRKP